MNISILKTLPLFALAAMPASAQVAGYEYWLDNDYGAKAVVMAPGGSIAEEVDVSALAPGLHRFQLRVVDAQGRWSSPLCRQFVCLGPDYGGNAPSHCQYSVDGGAWREAAMSGGVANIDVPTAGFAPGLHRIVVRVGDGVGRWSGAMARQFLCLGPDYGQNKPARYEWWMDGDVAGRTGGTVADGRIQLDIDAAGLSYGLHHITLRTQDEAGRWSSPAAHNFVKPEPSLVGNAISAYEYWFNRGAVRRVGVGPANPFVAEGLLVEVKDVVPNDIEPDYTVDWAASTLTTADDVVFGIRYGDARGRWSEARTDTFACSVPVGFSVERLPWGDTVRVVGPEAGNVFAYDVVPDGGDSLLWCSTAPCVVDLYDAAGVRFARLGGDGKAVSYKMRAEAGGRIVALVYGATADTLGLCCHRPYATGIASVESGVSVAVSGGRIVVSGAEGFGCTVYAIEGYAVAARRAMGAKESFGVSPGVYVVALTDRSGNTTTRTVAVK